MLPLNSLEGASPLYSISTSYQRATCRMMVVIFAPSKRNRPSFQARTSFIFGLETVNRFVLAGRLACSSGRSTMLLLVVVAEPGAVLVPVVVVEPVVVVSTRMAP